MWPKIYIFASLLIVTFASDLSDSPFIVNRYMSEGVKSSGYKIVYGDEDLTIMNEAVNDLEKDEGLKEKFNLNEALPPLPPEDVKCMMSVDRYCSKEMGEVKAVIIQAVKEDCKQCTNDQKEKAGKVIASMMAHDPVAWKLFLTRYDGLDKVQKLIGSTFVGKLKEPPKEELPKFKEIGQPEDVPRSKYKYVFPGLKVRVRRYVAKKM